MHTQLKMYAKTYTPNCILHYAKALGLDPINFQFSSLRKLLQATIPVVEYKRKLISCYVTILKYLHWKFQLFNFKWCYLRWASNRIFSSKHTFKFIPLRVRACVCVCVCARFDPNISWNFYLLPSNYGWYHHFRLQRIYFCSSVLITTCCVKQTWGLISR